jgi:glyoxylase I family protein
MNTFPPITHVAVTVSDLETSVRWYTRLFDTGPVLDEDTGPFRHVVWALGETLFGLHLFPGAHLEAATLEQRAGLDHIAFAAQSRAELEKWAARLDELGIDHGSVQDAGYGSGLSFRDPDNIPLEFFAPPAE